MPEMPDHVPDADHDADADADADAGRGRRRGDFRYYVPFRAIFVSALCAAIAILPLLLSIILWACACY